MSDKTMTNSTVTNWHVVVWKDGKPGLAEPRLTQPLTWKKPRKIFVCAHADLFHPNVPDEWINRVFAVMALAPQHTFMVLTKRPARMLKYFNDIRGAIVSAAALGMVPGRKWERSPAWNMHWPLPNVMLGVTAEDQQRADERIPDLLATPAAKRFVSIEPMLGPVDLSRHLGVELISLAGKPHFTEKTGYVSKLDLIICGGESGPGARPMQTDWARSLRDQCTAAARRSHRRAGMDCVRGRERRRI